MRPVQGEFRADAPGELVLTWDNGFSMFTSNELVYNVCVEAVQVGGGEEKKDNGMDNN